MVSLDDECLHTYYRTVFKYRRSLRIVAFVLTGGNNILHCVSAVVTVVIELCENIYLVSRQYSNTVR